MLHNITKVAFFASTCNHTLAQNLKHNRSFFFSLSLTLYFFGGGGCSQNLSHKTRTGDHHTIKSENGKYVSIYRCGIAE